MDKVFSYFECEADAKAPYRIAEPCDVSVTSVQTIISKGKPSLSTSGLTQFQSPGKHHKRKKTDFDDFGKDVFWCRMFDVYAPGGLHRVMPISSVRVPGTKWKGGPVAPSPGFVPGRPAYSHFTD